MSDIDTEVVDSLKVLDPDGRLEKRPNRCVATKRCFVPLAGISGSTIRSFIAACEQRRRSQPIGALALRLRSRSSFVDCWTSRSVGF